MQSKRGVLLAQDKYGYRKYDIDRLLNVRAIKTFSQATKVILVTIHVALEGKANIGV
ncbi:hypothetical protein ABUU69_001256 [Vibrio cholerae]|nr:hypothetical protein [Vibrio cholerae]EKF9401214.1 hypothetical protein [Vibrio cholerae]